MSDFKLKTGGKSSKRSPSAVRWVAWILGVLFAFLLVAYFVVTSGPFLRRFALPRVNAALNAELTAGSISLSPFRRLVLRDVKLTPKGGETLFTVRELKVRYSLTAYFGGRIEVQEILLDSPTLSVAEMADGKSNLDPLLKSSRKSKPRTSKGKSATIQPVSVKSLNVTNATLKFVKQSQTGSSDVLELSGLSLVAADVRNNQAGKMDFNARLAFAKSGEPTNAGVSSLAARLGGSYTFHLAQNLKPTALKGQAEFTVEKGNGAFADLAGVVAALVADATPTEIKQLEMNFTKAGTRLGAVRVNGPFDSAKREGKLNLEVTSIDRHVLNLLGAASGLDFGGTTINSTNEIEVAKSGTVLSIFGDLSVAKGQAIRDGHSTPVVNLAGDYSIAVDLGKGSAVIGTLKFDGTQDKRPFLTAGLSGPMTITWSTNVGDTAGNSTFSFALTDLDVTQWKPFLGSFAQTGNARVEGKISAREDGKLLGYEIKMIADSLTLALKTNRIDRLAVSFDATGQAKQLKQFTVGEYGAQVFQAGQPAFSFQGNAHLDTVAKNADAEVSMFGSIPQLASMMAGMIPLKSSDIASGALDLRGKFIKRPGTNLFAGRLRLVDLTAKIGACNFEHFGSDAEAELLFEPNRVNLRKVTGNLSENSKPGGKFAVSGNLGLAGNSTDLTLKCMEVGPGGLRPFLEPRFSGKKLTTASLNGTTALMLSPTGELGLKGDLTLTNLTATDLLLRTSTKPFQIRAQVETTVTTNQTLLKQCQLTFTPTEKAKNQITLTGSVNYANTNAIAGSLKLAAESLDLTRIYDLISGPAQPVRPGQTAPAPGAASLPQKEPDPVTLRFKDFIAEININRASVREVEVADFQARTRLDGSRVTLKPCFLTLNGAPVKAGIDLDLAVPGYRYEINFDAQAVPVAPVVNTFMPARRGHFGGQFTGVVTVKGEGITGPNLQKNLSGQISCVTTNINLSIANSQSPFISVLVNTIIGLPGLINNPLAPFENLVSRLVNFRGQKDGWTDQLMDSPIEVIETRIQAGEGHVRVEQTEVRSAAFKARTSGEITLAPVLTNSAISFPVSVSLSHPLAKKIGLIPADTPPNAAYFAMPNFLKMTGTLGKPEREVDKLALAAFTAQAGAGVLMQIPGNASEKAGSLLQKGGNLLGGLIGAGKSSQAGGTNAPAKTNSGLFELFK